MGLFSRKKKEVCPHCGKRSLVDTSSSVVDCCYCGLIMSVEEFGKTGKKPPKPRTISEPIE